MTSVILTLVSTDKINVNNIDNDNNIVFLNILRFFMWFRFFDSYLFVFTWFKNIKMKYLFSIFIYYKNIN